jgi:2',3'-cyclic-nucleotide 2'-phosphodiesterase (5'-nucleotidase family)
MIIRIKDNEIGLIGFTSTSRINETGCEGGVDFFDEIPTVRSEVKRLKVEQIQLNFSQSDLQNFHYQDQGVEIIIAFGHSGLEQSMEIARKVDDLDLVIGGDPKTFLFSGQGHPILLLKLILILFLVSR